MGGNPICVRLGFCGARELKLPYRDHQPVEIGGDDQSGLAARQSEYRAVLVGEHDPASAHADRDARTGSAIDAIHVGGPADIGDRTNKVGRRGAEGKSVAHAADRERIASSLEHQRAAAAGAADDKTRLDHVKADAAAVGVARRERRAGYSQSNQCGANGGR
jgi:hypothetical protein